MINIAIKYQETDRRTHFFSSLLSFVHTDLVYLLYFFKILCSVLLLYTIFSNLSGLYIKKTKLKKTSVLIILVLGRCRSIFSRSAVGVIAKR